MIAFNLSPAAAAVAQRQRDVVRLSDTFRAAAALVLDDVLAGVSTKRVRAAGVPGMGVTFLSRCKNGDHGNPLWRLASLFVLMKRLGLGRERAQRIIDWLQEIVDQVWPVGEAPEFEQVMEDEQELDAADDPCQMRAVHGDADALREFIAVKAKQRAHDAVVIQASRKQLATLTAGN
jgi:hypothetical protein